MYVVAGVTGNTGRAAASALLESGQPVRVLVRSADKGEIWKSRGAEVAVASLSDARELTAALRGASGAYLLVPPNLSSMQTLTDRAVVVDAIADAVHLSGISHVVALSSCGAQHATGTGLIRSLHSLETALSASARNVTFLRAAYFLENWTGNLRAAQTDGMLYSFIVPEKKIPMVATADIGRAAADALSKPARGRRIIELSGPEDYSPKDIADVLSSLFQRAVRVQPLPVAAAPEALAAAGISADAAILVQEMYEGINSGFIDFEGGVAERVRGTVTAADALSGLLRSAARAS